MMRRLGALVLAAALIGGLFAIPAGPAGAQNGGSMLDAPRLGFEIDPKAGNVGDTVAAQVNPVDVEEHCVTAVEELEAQFFSPLDPPGERNLPYVYPGPVLSDWMEHGPLVGIEPLDPWPIVVPPFLPQEPDNPPDGVGELNWAWEKARGAHGSSGFSGSAYQPYFRTNYDQLAAVVAFGFFSDLGGETTVVSELVQDLYLPQTFVLTMVDPATQALVGEMSTFDPSDGTGSLEVGDVAAGLWGIAAACIEPAMTEESFLRAIQAGAEWLESNEYR